MAVAHSKGVVFITQQNKVGYIDISIIIKLKANTMLKPQLLEIAKRQPFDQGN